MNSHVAVFCSCEHTWKCECFKREINKRSCVLTHIVAKVLGGIEIDVCVVEDFARLVSEGAIDDLIVYLSSGV